MWIVALEVHAHILDKIETKHGVTWEEVEEACYGAHQGYREDEDVYLLYGRTAAGRYLLAVLIKLGGGSWRVATARDMTLAERRWYQGHGGK